MPRALILPAILLLALALRLCGAPWGLPDERHLFSYHPDEYATALTAARMVATGDLNPRMFNYGSLGFYLPAAWLWPAWQLGGARDPHALYLWLRLLPILWSTLTVVLVARIGARLGGDAAGTLAAASFAVAPGSVLIAHFATVDTQATCLVALALLLALRHLQDGHSKDLVLGAIAAGAAAATKYPTGLVLLAGVAAAGLRGHLVRGALLAGLAALATLLICTPHLLLDWPAFWGGVRLEFAKQGQASGTLFDHTGNGLWYLVRTNLPFLTGVPLLLLALVGAETVVRTRRRAALVLLGFVVPCVALLALATMRFLRYALPLLPVLAALAGVAAAHARTPVQRWGSAAALVLALVLSTAQSLVMAGPDARDQAAAWCRAQAAHARVGLVEPPDFWTPPLTLHNGGAFSRDAFLAEQQQGGGRIVVTGWSVDALRQQAPELFVLSEFERREAERLMQPQALAFLAELAARYDRAATFAPWPAAWRQTFVPGFVPHDWLYPFAEMRVYRRRG